MTNKYSYSYGSYSSIEDLNLCSRSSFSLHHGDFEPDCTSITCWKKKPNLICSDSDSYSALDFDPDKQETNAFMTGDMLSFKQNLERRFSNTLLTFTNEENNSVCYNNKARNEIGNNINVLHPEHELKSPINFERIYCKEHSVSLNDVPSLHHDQFSLNKFGMHNQDKVQNGKEMCSSVVKLKKYTKKMKKTTLEHSPKYQPGTLTWVKPFKMTNKTKPVNKNKEFTKNKKSSKVNLLITSDQKLQRNCKINRALTVQKKRNLICVGTQYSDVFSNEIVSVQKDLNKTDSTKNTTVDINLKNSYQILAVAELIIETLNQNFKFPPDGHTKNKRLPKIIKKFFLTQNSIPKPGKMKQFCYPLKKKLKNNEIFKEKSDEPSTSVQFCLDRFASAIEKELLIRSGKAKEKNNQSNFVEEKHDKNLHPEDMFRKFERECDEEISKIKEKTNF